jgi:hypothetical protein
MSGRINLSRRRFLGAAAMTMAAAQFGQTAFAASGVDRRRPAVLSRPSNYLAELAAADCGRAAGQSRTGRLLDVYLHQLAPATPLRPCVGRTSTKIKG